MKYILILLFFTSCVVIHIQPKEKAVEKTVKEILQRPDTAITANDLMFSKDRLFIKVDTMRSVLGCSHIISTATLLYCPPGVQCNTATCTSCGYKWNTY